MADPLTFEFEAGCANTIIVDGTRVIFPCIPSADDICVQNLHNVVFTEGNEIAGGTQVVWDPTTCTMGLAVDLDCGLVDWDSTLEVGPAATGCTSAYDCGARFARDTATAALTHVCVNGEWVSLGNAGCALVSWSSASQAVPPPADCTTCNLFAYDAAINSITHTCVAGVWVPVGPASVCDQLVELPISATVPGSGDTLVGFDENGQCTRFPAPLLCDLIKAITKVGRVATDGDYVLGLTAAGACVLFDAPKAVGTGGSGGTGGADPGDPAGLPPLAVNDTETAVRPVGTAFTIDVAANDRVCSLSATTWVLLPATLANCTVTPATSTDGIFEITPGGTSCDWSFQYAIYCGGVNSGAVATVSGHAAATGYGPELFVNGNFSSYVTVANATELAPGTEFATGWRSTRPTNSTNQHSPDGYVTMFTGTSSFGVNRQPFPGDPGNGVAAAANWLEANGNPESYEATICKQQVSLVAGTTYEVTFYVVDCLDVGSAAFKDTLRVMVNGTSIGTVAVPAAVDATTWTRVLMTFTATASGAQWFEVLATDVGETYGNDTGLAAFSMRSIQTCPPVTP